MSEAVQETYEDQVAVMVFTDTDQDFLSADAYLKRYPGGKIILLATNPEGEEPYRTYSQNTEEGSLVRIAPNSRRNARWLQFGDRISVAVLAERDAEGHTASVGSTAAEVKGILDRNGWSLAGILPAAFHGLNEVGIARFAEAIGLKDYTSIDAVRLCNDKLDFSEMLRNMPSTPELSHLVVPKDMRCRDAAVGEDAHDKIWEDIQAFMPKVMDENGKWVIVLKPTWGGGSLGARILTSEHDEDTIHRLIDEHLQERPQMPLLGGPEVSMIQEGVGTEEVGIHAIRKPYSLKSRIEKLYDEFNAPEISDGNRLAVIWELLSTSQERPLPEDFFTNKDAFVQFIHEAYSDSADPVQAFLDAFQHGLVEEHPLKHLEIPKDEILIEMTMKEMNAAKEDAHFIPGVQDTELRKKYDEYKAVISPVIKQVYAEMERRGMNLRHMNFDVRVWKDKETGEVKFSLVDAQPRSGLGHPEMLDWVYSKDGVTPAKAQELLMAMSLDIEDPGKVMQEYAQVAKTANYSATVDTLNPKGGIVHGNLLALATAVHSRAPGIFYASAPYLVAGDRVSELVSLNLAGLHMTVGSYDPLVAGAAMNTNAFVHGLGLSVAPDGVEVPGVELKPIGIEVKGGQPVPEVEPLVLEHLEITAENCHAMTGAKWEKVEELSRAFHSVTTQYPSITVPSSASYPGGTIRFATTETANNAVILLVNHEGSTKGGRPVALEPFLYRPQDGRMWGVQSHNMRKRLRHQLGPRINEGWSNINRREVQSHFFIPYLKVELTEQDRDHETADPLGDATLSSVRKTMVWRQSGGPVAQRIRGSRLSYARIAGRMRDFAEAMGYPGEVPTAKMIKGYHHGASIPRDDIFIGMFGAALDIDAQAARTGVAADRLWEEFSDAIKRRRAWVVAAPGELSNEWSPRTYGQRTQKRYRRFTIPWFFKQKQGLTDKVIADRMARSIFEAGQDIQVSPIQVGGWRTGGMVPRILVPYLAKAMHFSELAAKYDMSLEDMNAGFIRIATGGGARRTRVKPATTARGDASTRFTVPWFFAQRQELTDEVIVDRMISSLWEAKQYMQLGLGITPTDIGNWRAGEPVPRILAPYLAEALDFGELARREGMHLDAINAAFCRLATDGAAVEQVTEPAEVDAVAEVEQVEAEVRAFAESVETGRRSSRYRRLVRPSQDEEQYRLRRFFDIARLLYANSDDLIVLKFNTLAQLEEPAVPPMTPRKLQRLKAGELGVSVKEMELIERATGLDIHFRGKDRLRQQFRRLILDEAVAHDALRRGRSQRSPPPSVQPPLDIPKFGGRKNKSLRGRRGGAPVYIDSDDATGVKAASPEGRQRRRDRAAAAAPAAGRRDKGDNRVAAAAYTSGGDLGGTLLVRAGDTFSLLWFFHQTRIGKDRQTPKSKAEAIAARVREKMAETDVTIPGQGLPGLIARWMDGEPIKGEKYLNDKFLACLAYGIDVREIAQSAHYVTGDPQTDRTLLEDELAAVFILAAKAKGQSFNLEQEIAWDPSQESDRGRRGRGGRPGKFNAVVATAAIAAVSHFGAGVVRPPQSPPPANGVIATPSGNNATDMPDIHPATLGKISGADMERAWRIAESTRLQLSPGQEKGPALPPIMFRGDVSERAVHISAKVKQTPDTTSSAKPTDISARSDFVPPQKPRTR